MSSEVAESRTRPIVLAPERVIRNDVDARILLGLWIARKSFFPLLMAGFIVAAAWFLVVVQDPETFVEGVNGITTPTTAASAAFSPFALVAVAVGMRLAIAVGALVAAVPLALANHPNDYPHAGHIGRHVRTWWDRWKMSQSYRAFRWTWWVHGAVIDRLDARGSIWERWDRISVILNILLAIGFVIVFMTAAFEVAVETGSL